MLIPTDILKAALLCVSTEQARYYLCGVAVQTSGHVVTTDGHRMFVAKLAEAPAADVIIPTETVRAALKLAPKRAETIELNGNTLGGVVFQPVDGTFPNWRQIIPSAEGYQSGNTSEAAHFNPDYIYDLGQMARALGGSVSSFKMHAWDRESPHGVTFAGREDCFAVIMPMRQAADVTPWATARAIA